MKIKHWSSLTLAAGVVAALLFAVSFTPSASANTLTLVSPAPEGQQYQQTLNSPCIYGDPSCKQPAGFGETSISAGGNCCTTFGGTTPGLVSVTYTVSQIEAAIGGNTFIVGIDVNQTGTSSPANDPFLVYFDMAINGTITDHFGTCCGATGGGDLKYPNNGNGFADNLLTGFTSLSGLPGTTQITFHLNYYGADDGTEEFFLVNTASPPPVAPEPGTLVMFGSGLIGLAGVLRRRLAR